MALEIGEIRVNVARRYWVPLVVIGSIFSVALHFYRAHGEAFEFADQAIRKSAAIQRRIGDVQEIRLGILESYKERFVGSTMYVHMAVHVTGSSGSARVVIDLRRVKGLWAITDASIGTESIILN
ncbi:MAG: hypothetical protein ACLPX1_11395 [Steroidobacteraceae bacterium]